MLCTFGSHTEMHPLPGTGRKSYLQEEFEAGTAERSALLPIQDMVANMKYTLEILSVEAVLLWILHHPEGGTFHTSIP